MTTNNIASEVGYSIWLLSEPSVAFCIFVVSATAGMTAIVKVVIIITNRFIFQIF
jgi:hypothetical protein